MCLQHGSKLQRCVSSGLERSVLYLYENAQVKMLTCGLAGVLSLSILIADVVSVTLIVIALDVTFTVLLLTLTPLLTVICVPLLIKLQ